MGVVSREMCLGERVTHLVMMHVCANHFEVFAIYRFERRSINEAGLGTIQTRSWCFK